RSYQPNNSTISTCTPVSSWTSRMTVSSTVSPGAMLPPGNSQKRGLSRCTRSTCWPCKTIACGTVGGRSCRSTGMRTSCQYLYSWKGMRTPREQYGIGMRLGLARQPGSLRLGGLQRAVLVLMQEYVEFRFDILIQGGVVLITLKS